MKKRHSDPGQESAVVAALAAALGPVQPSEAFRRHLSSNLSLAARRKLTGEPIIESPIFFARRAIIVAGVIGSIATALAAVLYFRQAQRRA